MTCHHALQKRMKTVQENMKNFSEETAYARPCSDLIKTFPDKKRRWYEFWKKEKTEWND